MSGTVYYIACTTTELVKIGYTSGSVHARMKALQTGSASELVLIAAHDGTPDMEKRAHELFAEHRVRGEWFKMSKELFEFIAYTVFWTANQLNKRGAPLPEWVEIGLSSLLAHENEATIQ